MQILKLEVTRMHAQSDDGSVMNMQRDECPFNMFKAFIILLSEKCSKHANILLQYKYGAA